MKFLVNNDVTLYPMMNRQRKQPQRTLTAEEQLSLMIARLNIMQKKPVQGDPIFISKPTKNGGKLLLLSNRERMRSWLEPENWIGNDRHIIKQKISHRELFSVETNEIDDRKVKIVVKGVVDKVAQIKRLRVLIPGYGKDIDFDDVRERMREITKKEVETAWHIRTKTGQRWETPYGLYIDPKGNSYALFKFEEGETADIGELDPDHAGEFRTVKSEFAQKAKREGIKLGRDVYNFDNWLVAKHPRTGKTLFRGLDTEDHKVLNSRSKTIERE
ncbi:MAG: hypothetical protein ABH950_01275 [Candidatus Altiarchaeota archaeon]